MNLFPGDADEWLREAREFWIRIRRLKSENRLPDGDWYPYDSLAALPVIADLLKPDYREVAAAITRLPVADLGCGDGDFAMLFASWGAEVDAIDYAVTNYNRMEGIRTLSRISRLPVSTHSLDLDVALDLPRECYGLTLFFGILYHLKNPYSALVRLAYYTRWCILSTRIAQRTPRTHIIMEGEPLAYLADGREIANDATNYWIFSATGLLRMLQRTRWAIAGSRRVGCSLDSTPTSPNADERMFLLLKSRVHHPWLQVRLLDGWYHLENGFRWTACRFAIEVVLPLETPVTTFVLSAFIPEEVIATEGRIRILCCIAGESVAALTRESGGPFELVGSLPESAAHEPILRLDFAVESGFRSSRDSRELGICVPLGSRLPIDFRVH